MVRGVVQYITIGFFMGQYKLIIKNDFLLVLNEAVMT